MTGKFKIPFIYTFKIFDLKFNINQKYISIKLFLQSVYF